MFHRDETINEIANKLISQGTKTDILCLVSLLVSSQGLETDLAHIRALTPGTGVYVRRGPKDEERNLFGTWTPKMDGAIGESGAIAPTPWQVKDGRVYVVFVNSDLNAWYPPGCLEVMTDTYNRKGIVNGMRVLIRTPTPAVCTAVVALADSVLLSYTTGQIVQKYMEEVEVPKKARWSGVNKGDTVWLKSDGHPLMVLEVYDDYFFGTLRLGTPYLVRANDVLLTPPVREGDTL